jgi:hypothetical protein
VNLCESIDTLAMALHDGELAGEELRDLELHLTECTPCLDHASAQATSIGSLRRKLAAPPAPELLRAKVRLGLDAEDRAARKPVSSWLLPGAAMVAAAAALAVFVTARPAAKERTVDDVVATIATRSRPLEVQGAAATSRWVERHYDANVALPTFASARVHLWGARLTNVYDREAVQLYYRITTPEEFTRDLQVIVFDARNMQFSGRRVDVNDRALLIGMNRNLAVVSYRDDRQKAYVFTSTQMSVDELVDMVGGSSLLIQVRDDERRR